MNSILMSKIFRISSHIYPMRIIDTICKLENRKAMKLLRTRFFAKSVDWPF